MSNQPYEASIAAEPLESRMERYCATCHGTGSKDGKHLDCPHCDAAEIIAAHEQRNAARNAGLGMEA